MKDTIAKVCETKFPSIEDVCDEEGHLKEGYPKYLATLAYFRTVTVGVDFYDIARKDFGINLRNGNTTKSNVDELINSCREYLTLIDNNVEKGKTLGNKEEKLNALRNEKASNTPGI